MRVGRFVIIADQCWDLCFMPILVDFIEYGKKEVCVAKLCCGKVCLVLYDFYLRLHLQYGAM